MENCDLTLANEILNNLLALNISEEPQCELIEIIKRYDFGKILSSQTIRKGSFIYRARANNGSELFVTSSELSYPPKECCNRYQRANIKESPMFYGSFDDVESHSKNDIYYCMAGMVFESNNQIQDYSLDAKLLITFGVWEVTKDINLCSFPYHQNIFPALSNRVIELHKESICDLSKRNGYDILNNTLLDFLIKRLSSSSTNEHDYFIIANVIHYIISKYKDNGLNGILYLSVPMNGLTTNVALTPETVDNNLQFKRAEMIQFKIENGDMELRTVSVGTLSNNNIEYKTVK